MKLILALTLCLFPIVAQAQNSTPVPSERHFVYADACVDLASVDKIRASNDQEATWKALVADHKCVEAGMGIAISGTIRFQKVTWNRLYEVVLAELLNCDDAAGTANT